MEFTHIAIIRIVVVIINMRNLNSKLRIMQMGAKCYTGWVHKYLMIGKVVVVWSRFGNS